MGMRQGMTKLPEFEMARKRVGQQQQTRQQETEDALTRRYARMGGLNSGSFIKQQQIAGDQLAQEKDNAFMDIDLAEAAERRRMEEQNVNRQFASQEAEKARLFSKGERESAQGYASGEREASQGFQREMSDKDLSFRDKLFQFDKESKLKQMDMAEREFAADQKTTEFNKMVSLMGLNNHGQIVSGLRSMVEDKATSPAARSAAMIYLTGLNDRFISSENLVNFQKGNMNRQQAIDASDPSRLGLALK